MTDALAPKTPRARTFDDGKKGALAAWLGRTLRAPVAIIDARLLTGGAVQENWRLDVTVGDEPKTWVLRTDGAQTLGVSIDRDAEYAVIEAALAAGVPVADPVARCTDTQVIGRPFLIQRFVAGIAAARQVARRPDLATFGDDLARDLGRTLARIHSITPKSATAPALPIPMLQPARAEVAKVRAALARASQPRPALEYALAWLDANAPESPAMTLVHGDYRTGNYLLDGTRISAILDWEFAHWGDAHEDIGWICARCWRAGNDEPHQEAGGIGNRLALYDGYNEIADRKVDAAVIPYWEIMAAAKWAVLAILQGDRFLVGAETAIELALTGLMAPEMEFDALEGIAAIEAARKKP